MKSIFKYLMILLSYSPIVTVAVAAQAKASEIEGEGQNEILAKQVSLARSRVLEVGQTTATYAQVTDRYSARTGLTGDFLAVSLKRDLEFLIYQGVIVTNEKEILSHGPSQYQSP
jgi:hypothetical protein